MGFGLKAVVPFCWYCVTMYGPPETFGRFSCGLNSFSPLPFFPSFVDQTCFGRTYVWDRFESAGAIGRLYRITSVCGSGAEAPLIPS